MNPQTMQPHEILTKIQLIFEKAITKQKPQSKTSQHRDLPLALALECTACILLLHQINKSGIGDKVLDCLTFQSRKLASYMESLSGTYGQAGCGAKRKTEKEVQADLELAGSKHPTLQFWKTSENYCTHLTNKTDQAVIIIISHTAIELTKKVVTSKGVFEGKAGGTNIVDVTAGGNITAIEEYENTTSVSAYTISPFQADEIVLSHHKDLKISILVPLPSAKMGSNLYFCPKQNVCHNAKYFNYEIPKMSYTKTQPVVKYDGFSIVPQSPNKLPRSIGRSTPPEMPPDLYDGPETSK